jgi:hypothetical protein
MARSLVLLFIVAISAQAGCPPSGFGRSELTTLKDKAFQLESASKPSIDVLAIGMLDCLSDPDPLLRDGIAYEAFASWMSSNALADSTLDRIRATLLSHLQPDWSDPQGFGRPFAALVLAELVRTDKERNHLTETQLAELVRASTRYLETLRDYRGFDPRQGWRHGVAHTADLMMYLADHPRVDEVGLRRIVAAVGTQIIAHDRHFYIHGEPERLARPLLFAARRGLMSADEWGAWFMRLASEPDGAPLFASEAGLSRRHNLQALLLTLYANVAETRNEALRSALRQPVLDAIIAIN